jgi:hypothetical protein
MKELIKLKINLLQDMRVIYSLADLYTSGNNTEHILIKANE